jgi:YHS domain-containing protein
MKTLKLLIACLAVLLAGCAPFSTQSPGQGLSPVNAVSDGEDRHLMLKGYDVVSYFTEGKEHPGLASIRSEYKGVAFRFAGPQHKALFDAAPEKYLPQYGGYCANGIVYGIPWGGDADTWRIFNGKLYIFGGRQSRDAFLLDVPKNIALADKYWAEEVNGSNALIQRLWRLVDRVPHYRTSAQLAEDLKQAGKR